ncbi:DNA replication and repair protein RecF [Candidatus Dojkabacteria bacterium]|nr:DNA replication and repair protein RecF [Candidatus Dojkabacteria bacterium]
MPLKRIKFNNFKNLKGEYNLSDRINIIIGNNGQGKTNFLEGLYFLSFGSGFGSTQEVNVINWDSESRFFSIVGLIQEKENEIKLEIKYENSDATLGRKKFTVNEVGRARKFFIGNLSSTIFAPQSVDLVAGSPDIRRKAIDDVLSLLDLEYADTLSKYRNILRNRNKILSNLNDNVGHPRELVYWNEALIEEGSRIISARIKFFDDYKSEITNKAKKLFNNEFKDLKIDYLSKFFDTISMDRNKIVTTQDLREKIKGNFGSKIQRSLQKEIRAGVTLYGPHRENYEFKLGGTSLRESGSRGQQRLASLIFVLTVFDIFEKSERTSAILLLDDVMSELDSIHRTNIERMLLSSQIQVVITTAEKENFTKKILEKANIILM